MVDSRVALLREFCHPLPVLLVRLPLGFQLLSKSLGLAVPYPGVLLEITFALQSLLDIINFLLQMIERSTSPYFVKDFLEDLAHVVPKCRFVEGADANWRIIRSASFGDFYFSVAG